MDELIAYLNERHGLDLGGYRRVGLERRLRRRMSALQLDSFESYQLYLGEDPGEVSRLLDVAHVNMTRFFRDEPAWQALANAIEPRLRDPSRKVVRVWSAGCSSGQEAFSIAMVLAERVALDRFARSIVILATDIDEQAIAQAREASYTRAELASMRPDLVAKYFELRGDRYVCASKLRRSIGFVRHDLRRHAPSMDNDLVVCRNTMMYFDEDTQARILDAFEAALAPGGLLFLGRGEFATHPHLAPVDRTLRIFRKVECLSPAA